MPVTDGYIAFVRDLLRSFEPLRVKRMFGGAGIYSRDVFFAIVVDDALYLEVDDHNRSGYESRGLRPFTYQTKNGRTTSMSYYPVPPEVLDDPEALAIWAGEAVEVPKLLGNSHSDHSRHGEAVRESAEPYYFDRSIHSHRRSAYQALPTSYSPVLCNKCTEEIK
jgi:DNA transformation protein